MRFKRGKKGRMEKFAYSQKCLCNEHAIWSVVVYYIEKSFKNAIHKMLKRASLYIDQCTDQTTRSKNFDTDIYINICMYRAREGSYI